MGSQLGLITADKGNRTTHKIRVRTDNKIKQEETKHKSAGSTQRQKGEQTLREQTDTGTQVRKGVRKDDELNKTKTHGLNET